MATKYYILSDGEYREEYPMHNNLDIEKFYSVQRIEQNTTVYDFLGDNLADYLLGTILPTSSIISWEIEFLGWMQKLMVFYVARGLESYNENASNDNRVSSIRSKVVFYESKIRAFIAATPELVTIQDDDNEPNREDYQGLPTYFFR